MRTAVVLTFIATFALVTHAVLAQPAPRTPLPGGQVPMHGTPGAMSHAPMHAMHHGQPAAGAPTMPGQDAFGAIAEVVRLLDADPGTDWAKVDLERLRQHLIDMNEVVLRARVVQTPIPGGLGMEVTGAGRTEQAIRAMLVPHAAELDRMSAYAAKVELIPGGVKLTATSKTPEDARAVARLRALGFVGLLAEGEHHGPHHLAMAKGERLAGHAH